MTKIDCSITVNFLKERQRMCDSYGQKCKDCVLRKMNKYPTCTCSDYMYAHPDTAVEVVQKWSDEHMVKTRLDDIKERCPNVPLNGEGYPRFSPGMLGYCGNCDICRNWKKPYIRNCWDEPLVGGATGKEVE